jgi:ParB-like chromosome segregation protein Spo0J
MDIRDLKLNKSNPRFIKDERFKKLCQSVKDFSKMMELRPIVCNKDGLIIGGNMRYRALKELGYKEVPDSWVKVTDKLTEEEEKRFIIEDNLNFGDWDFEILANEWDSELLNDWGMEIPKTEEDTQEEKEKQLQKCPNCGFEY